MTTGQPTLGGTALQVLLSVAPPWKPRLDGTEGSYHPNQLGSCGGALLSGPAWQL